jgi:predicted ATPase
MCGDGRQKQKLLSEVQLIYDGIEDFEARIDGGTAQLLFKEKGKRQPIPATRLADGALRHVFLLAVLCDPSPPPLICLDQPEIGLHPDMPPHLAELLKSASERSQLIVTTHSEIIVEALTDMPESILVVEKTGEGTVIERLKSDELKPFLDKCRLGQLWSRGYIGGNR